MAGSVRVYGGNELRDLADQLRAQADGRARVRELTKGLRRASKPLSDRAKQSARGLPSQGYSARRGQPSLRRQLAKSVTTQIRTSGDRAGVRVFMNTGKMPDGRKTLPLYVEGVPKYDRWRHPVFGNQDVWVVQSSTPFFTDAISGAEDAARAAVRDVIDRVVEDLESQ